MEKDTTRPKYCGNLLARRTKRRSFINKLAFEGVFGVLSNSELMYFRSSSDWTNQEKPQFSMQLVDIQAVEEVDDVAFSRPSCFQVIHTSRSKKDKSIRSVYLAAYEEDEQKSWIKAIRSACLHNPIVLAYFHSGRFTGKTWTCCSEGKLHHGCKPCTIEGLPAMTTGKLKLKVSPAIEFHGFTVIANESFDSSLPGFLPFNKDDRLTVTEAAGKQEWKAFSASSTSEYGIIPCQSVSVVDISQEPWFFKGIPSGLVTALLREQEPGCFILRCHSASDANILSFRTEMAIKHVEIAFDESSQKFRIKDGSESVSYVNFLQFDTVQQLLDQCKQHPTLGVILDKYPSIETVDELWKINANEIIIGDEIESNLPWEIMKGKFRNQNALIHVRQIGCADSVKDVFTNQARILMTLSHENVVEFYGLGSKGSRACVLHSHYPNGVLSDYLTRNASLLISHPSELVNIITQILAGMVYLEEVGVVHGELITENCIISDRGVVKICGFHCARSSWCCKPIDTQLYSNKVPLIAPELGANIEPTSKTDVWVFGLLIYTIITAGQKLIKTVEQVLAIIETEDYLEELESFVEVMTSCLRKDPSCRPTFVQLLQRCSSHNRFPSTPSVSSYSLDLEDSFSASNGSLLNGLENSTNSEMASKELDERRYDSYDGGSRASISKSQSYMESRSSLNLSSIESRETNDVHFPSNEYLERVKTAELEALKAKALQRRAEKDKEEVLKQVREAEKKCLKEVELITRTFICRLNEANDRATDANEMRYLAEEAKRLAEEKCTLFKYESERTIHDIKSMLEDTMLERDELAESLKSIGMNADNNNESGESQERRDSLSELEKKYQRFISTSDRTIHNMKSQLDEVVLQRDALSDELTQSRQDLRETRDLLEQVIKEKEDLVFRLEEANCEVEKLEETISSMVHKREKAERERDQLQILTDMSLMKLRHVEKPKKRHSVGSIGTSYEKKDPNLRRLSVQLMNLRTSASKRRQSADVIYEVSEHSSSEEVPPSWNDIGEARSSNTSSIIGQSIEHSELCDLRCSTPKELNSSETEMLSSLSSLTNNDYVMDMLSQEHQLNAGSQNESEESIKNCGNKENRDMQDDQLRLDQVNEFVDNHGEYRPDIDDDDDGDNHHHHNHNCDVDKTSEENLIAESPPSFSIPKVLIDEFAEEDTRCTSKKENQIIPGIAISLVDDNVNVCGYFSEDEVTSERVFVVPFENGDTTMVYSFESDGGAKNGVPQTVL